MIVGFFRTDSGIEPVKKYLEKVSAIEQARAIAAFDDLAANGISGSSVILRQIEGKLWEIKVSSQRVFYVLLAGPEVVLLHAYKKEGQKAPKKEIRTAKKRMRIVLGEVK